MSSLHDFVLETIEGTPLRFADYAGRPVLIAIAALASSSVERWRALSSLQQVFRDRLQVVVIPERAWTGEDGASRLSLVRVRLGLDGPVTRCIETGGPAPHLLARWLAGPASPFPGRIAPFTRFLCDGAGRIVARYPPDIDLESPEVRAAIRVFLP